MQKRERETPELLPVNQRDKRDREEMLEKFGQKVNDHWFVRFTLLVKVVKKESAKTWKRLTYLEKKNKKTEYEDKLICLYVELNRKGRYLSIGKPLEAAKIVQNGD